MCVYRGRGVERVRALPEGCRAGGAEEELMERPTSLREETEKRKRWQERASDSETWWV